MPTPQEALAKFMSSPGIKSRMDSQMLGESYDAQDPGGYFARRQADITSGVDDMVPNADALEFRQAQKMYGGSRADARESSLAKVRGLLKMQQAEDQQAQQMAHIKGGYDVQGDVQSAQAAMDRVLAQQAGQTQRTSMQQEGMNTRSTADLEADKAANLRKDQQARAKQTSAAIKAINAQIAKMEADAMKNRPNALMKMFRGDPRGDAVQTAKQARDIALELARDYPDMDTEDAMLQAGYADYTPDELGQVNTFLGMLRGQ